ncbi:hypothetical protein NL676_016527 [Syzygium grande]|nr:hypothetical protein NL676_016527 [Syzygium grande]
MDGSILLYPSPGKGHLASMVELGKHILDHHPCFPITVLLLSTPPPDTHFVAAVSAFHPSITFHHLPRHLPPQIRPPLLLSRQLYPVHLQNRPPPQPDTSPDPCLSFHVLRRQSLRHRLLLEIAKDFSDLKETLRNPSSS